DALNHSSRTGCRSATRQQRTLQLLAARAVRPYGLKATRQSVVSPSRGGPWGRPVATSHSRTRLLPGFPEALQTASPPVRSVFPSGLKATHLSQVSWARASPRGCAVAASHRRAVLS